MRLHFCCRRPLLGAFLVLALAACAASIPYAPERPAWLKALIAQIASEPVTNPPSSIIRYRYRGVTVYYRPARCCDIFADLYDERGTVICHPDGGITGGGDGRCADFATARSEEEVVWEDPRL